MRGANSCSRGWPGVDWALVCIQLSMTTADWQKIQCWPHISNFFFLFVLNLLNQGGGSVLEQLCTKQSARWSIFASRRSPHCINCWERLMCFEKKQFRSVGVSLIALSVKVQLKTLRGELTQHSCSSLLNKKATRDIVIVSHYVYALMYYILKGALRPSPSIFL